MTVENWIVQAEVPYPACFCLEHMDDIAKVIPSLLAQMKDGTMLEVRIRSTAAMARDIEEGPVTEAKDDEVGGARRMALAHYMKLFGDDGDITHLEDHHSDEACMEYCATLVGALFRHGYLGMGKRKFDSEFWAQIMSIGLVRALAHGKLPHKERVECCRTFVSTAERMRKYDKMMKE